jgi:hypothetical protein
MHPSTFGEVAGGGDKLQYVLLACFWLADLFYFLLVESFAS